ncbi:MAG: hypothetical protein AAGB22_14525, partial [Bacteroidota bacterium]
QLDSFQTLIRSIDRIARYDRIDTLEIAETTELGEAHYFFLTRELKKITVWRFGETRKDITTFYLDDEALVFARTEEHTYNRPTTWDSTAAAANGDDQVFDPKQSEVVITETYFRNNAAFHHTASDDCGAPWSEEYLKLTGSELLQRFRSHLQLLNKRANE